MANYERQREGLVQKVCWVCAEDAISFNYGAMSCESCKTFFRRNAHRLGTLKCPYNNECIINKFTRRFCPKCRVAKCFQIGMKKEMIKPAEQSNPDQSKTAKKSSSGGEPKNNNFSDKEKYWEAVINHSSVQARFMAASLSNPVDRNNSLNNLESARIDELENLYATIAGPIVEHPLTDASGLADAIQFSDRAAIQIVQWAQILPPFANLCMEDKVILLKTGCLEMLCIQGVYQFDKENEGWKDTLTGHIVKFEVFRHASEQLYQAHLKFINKFNERWRTDHKVILLLMAIILFDFNRSNLLHHDTIRTEQYTYIYLLRRYLEAKSNSVCQAHVDYCQLMRTTEEVRELSESSMKFYSGYGQPV